MMSSDPILTIRGVRKTFEAEQAPVRALRGVDLDVGTGEFIAVMGPSGCGKSTLLNLIAGLDAPDEGEIVLGDQTLTGHNEDWLARMRRHEIGMVFQFFNLLEGMTVLENVALPAIIGGSRRRAAETHARNLLDLLGLGPKANEVPAVGWPAATPRDRPGARQRADPAPGRRTDRRARQRGRPGGARAVPPAPRRRADDHHGDAQRRGRGKVEPHRAHAGRPHRRSR